MTVCPGCPYLNRDVIAEDLRRELEAGADLRREAEAVERAREFLCLVAEQLVVERDRYVQRRADLSAASVRVRDRAAR